MDLTPDIRLSLMELNKCTRQRALAVLAVEDIDSLDALAGTFWADVLFVTGRKRASLDTEQLEALSKASAGLGYGATQYALLAESDEDVASVDAKKLEAYVQALSVDTIIFLEAELAQRLQDFPRNPSQSLLSNLPEEHPYLRRVVVTDFFAALEDGDDQQAKKQQAWTELQAAKRQSAL